MARLTVDYFSDVLGKAMSMTVLLPEETDAQVGASGVAPRPDGAPVLYLLHGHSDDHTGWTRRSSVERHVEEYGLAVVMPDAHRSFYTDEHHGLRHWTHLTEELPAKVSQFFHVSTRREDTFVAGLSMGGYGALKWALNHPDRFAAAASMSGALDVAELVRLGERSELFDRVYGAEGPGPQDDLLAVVEAADPAALPPLYLTSGTEDPLTPSTQRLSGALAARGVPPTTVLAPGGHEWSFWDEHLPHVLAWLPLRR